MKLGLHTYDFTWPGGASQLGPTLGLASMGMHTVLGVVPHVDRITPLEVIGREVLPAGAAL
jgi:hypothetical protein